MAARCLTAFLLLAAPVAGLAECPTADDMEKGIELRLDNGDTETFRTLKPGIVESFYKSDGYATRVLLAQGVYLLEVVDFDGPLPNPDTRTTYSYPTQPQDMPTPTPGGGWTVQAAMVSGGTPETETQQFQFGPMTEYTIGACTYWMIPIKTIYGEDGASSDLAHYFPALGLSYLAGFTDTDATTTFRYVAIEAVE